MKFVGNSYYQKEANMLLILNALRSRKSRIEIASELGLQPSTITYSIARLTDYGSVVAVPADDATESVKTMGRRRSMLCLNADFGRIVGIELMRLGYRLAIMDVQGHIVHQGCEEYGDDLPLLSPDEDGKERFTIRLKDILARAEALVGSIPILGAAVAVPGIVEQNGTFIAECWTHCLRNADFSDLLDSFDYPVIFENDANAAAVRYLASDILTQDSFLYVLARKHNPKFLTPDVPMLGLGMGLVLQGRLFRGANSRSGEYFGTRVPGSLRTHQQFPFGALELSHFETDEKLKREVLRSLLDDICTIASVLDVRLIYIGGFCAQMAYEELLDTILSEELSGKVAKLFERGTSLVYGDSLMDPAIGAASLVLSEMFTMPRLGEDDRAASFWTALIPTERRGEEMKNE